MGVEAEVFFSDSKFYERLKRVCFQYAFLNENLSDKILTNKKTLLP
jgi:hypothetical protein